MVSWPVFLSTCLLKVQEIYGVYPRHHSRFIALHCHYNLYLYYTSVCMSYPAIRAVPRVGSYIPVNTEMSVVFPAPAVTPRY